MRCCLQFKLALLVFVFAWEGSVSSDVNITWAKVDRLFRKMTNSVLSTRSMYSLYKFSKNLNLTADCYSSVFDLTLGLKNSKKWAIQMADASGKLPSGILDGTMLDLGSFDECLAIRLEADKTERFRGRYCMVGYDSPLLGPLTPKYIKEHGQPPEWIRDVLERAGGYMKKVSFWLGTCVPSTCTESDITTIAGALTKPLGFNVSISDCQIAEQFTWPTSTIIAVATLGVLATICVIGTTLDIINKYRKPSDNKISIPHENCLLTSLKVFSVFTNTQKLLRTEGEDDSLSFFHGLRFFSATWIILGHTYFFTDFWKYLKYRHLLGVTEQFNGYLPVAVLENFTIPVGSFFFMSGFLLVYTNWGKLERDGGRLNIFMFFLHKYWRMTPALLLAIGLLLVIPLIDSGPLWYSTLNPQIGVCEETWWRNILYISNWWNADEICLLHTWYLSALMQFHMVAIILLMLVFSWPVPGMIFGFLVTCTCVVITFFVALQHNIPMPAPMMIKDMDVIEEYNSVIYVKPYAHFVTYVLGMSVAYLVLKKPLYRMRPWLQILCWILATISALASVYGLYSPVDSPVLRAIYVAAYRIGWALGVGWLSFACASGMGGPVNTFLSWKAFAPLGRLSYLSYLVHPLIIMYRNASLRERVYYGHTELVYSFFGHFMVSFFGAFVCHVTVEMPFTLLERVIFKRSPKKSNKSYEQADPKCFNVSISAVKQLKEDEP